MKNSSLEKLNDTYCTTHSISKHEITQILLGLINIKTNRSCFLLSTHFVTISSY